MRDKKCIRSVLDRYGNSSLQVVGGLHYMKSPHGEMATVHCYGCGTTILVRYEGIDREKMLQEAYDIHEVAGETAYRPTGYYAPLR